jgi:flagellar biosynthesis protein FlhF
MSMRMKTFRAATMRGAMDEIKATLGSDAVILSSSVLRRGVNPQVEIVAALDSQPSGGADDIQLYDDNRFDPEILKGLRTELSEVRQELRRLRAQRVVNGASSLQWEKLMTELKDLAHVMGIGQGVSGAHDTLVSRLISGGVEASLAHVLVERAAKEADDVAHQTHLISQQMRKAFEAAPPLWDRKKRCVAAMVGPTGVGKTTTLAKIASRAALEKGRKVAVVAADTYRITGVEQIQAYSELIGVPWTVASSPKELSQSLQRFSEEDLVLVDTTGHNPWCMESLAQLDELLGGLPIERHLCISATSPGKDLAQIVSNYGESGLRSLIVTKLDEARTVGGLLSTVCCTDLQIALVTDGQNVPDDIDVPDANRLCSAVLG